MADAKLTALPTASTISATDIAYVVTDPGGTPVSRKTTFDNLQRSITAIGVLSTDISIPTANYLYIGPSGSNGSWRMYVSGNNLVFERRESGSWNEKGAITA